MASSWDVVGNIASVAQLSGLDALGIVGMVKEGVESVDTLQSDAKDLEVIVNSARYLWVDLSKSDNPNVRMCAQELDKALQTAQKKIIPEARFKTSAVAAGQMKKEVATSQQKVTGVLDLVNSALICESNEEIKEVKLALQAGLQQILAALQTGPQIPMQLAESSLLMKLKDLALRGHERIVLRMESTPFGKANWKEVGSTANPAPADHARGERGSVAADYQLFNNCNIRVTMQSHDTLYFYILTAESSDPSPKIHFPKATKKKNELRGERKFPNKMSHPDDDGSWMFTNPTRQIQTCYAIFIFTKERPPTGDAHVTTTLIEEMLSGEVIVEILTILVKNSVATTRTTRNTRIRI